MKINYKEALKALRDTFTEAVAGAIPVAAAPALAPPPVAPKSYTLIDGVTTVTIDNLAVGGKVVNATVPIVAAGSITLQDNTVVAYDATGTITAVTAAAPAPAPSIEDMATKPGMYKKLETISTTFALDDASANLPSTIAIKELIVMVKALMDYNFGYEIRQRTAEDAVNIYRENFVAAEKVGKDNNTVVIALSKKLDGVIELFDQFADTAIVASLEEDKTAFVELTQEQFEALDGRGQRLYLKTQAAQSKKA